MDQKNKIDENIDKVVNTVKDSQYVKKGWNILWKTAIVIAGGLLFAAIAVNLYEYRSQSDDDQLSDTQMKAIFGDKYQSAEETEVLIRQFESDKNTKVYTLEECKIAAIAFNKASNNIIIGKVQKGIRPTKTESCHIPNVMKAYLEKCEKYDDPKHYKQVAEIYPSYKYACQQWVEIN